MTVLLVALAALWLATCAYLVVVLRQIGAVRRQLEQRTGQDSPSAVTLALVVPQLERLTSRVNEAVEQSRQASMRTRAEERRIRSFIADISHDLRTPLTSVRGYLQLLERTELDAVQRERLAAAHRQSVELGALVDRLYEYAYLLDVEPRQEIEQLDVGLLVSEVLLGMTAEIEGAGLAVQLDPPTGLVLATDREMLTRIVQNLGRNAVQHGRGTLAVDIATEGAGVELRVRNGVAPGAEIDTARLFDRFFTADVSRSGRTSGLGLSIVQVLVTGLGGTVVAVHDPVAATLETRVRIPSAAPSSPR